MELTQSFRVGDRVRTLRKQGDLPKGSSGIIVRMFEAADCCDVLFDTAPGHRLVANSDLETVEREAEASQF